MKRKMGREQLESLADRAAEDGEHRVVAACQALLSSDGGDHDDEKIVAEYLSEITGL